MGYTLARNHVQHILVEERCHNQQMISSWHMRHQTPTVTLQGDSSALIASFRDAYRLRVLPVRPTSVTVMRYTMMEINNVSKIVPPADSCKPQRYRTEYDPEKKDVLEGGGGADTGTSITTKELPMHECIRILKKAVFLRRGYFEGSYHRISPLMEDEHSDTVPEEWTPECLAAYQSAWGAMNTTDYADAGPLPNIWRLAIWSPGYYWNVILTRPIPGEIYEASSPLSFQVMKTVGTQTTRRFSPTGFMEGK